MNTKRKLSPQQQTLLSQFGLVGNAERNRAQLLAYKNDPLGTNAYRAVRLARALASGTFGSQRKIKASAAAAALKRQAYRMRVNRGARLAKIRANTAGGGPKSHVLEELQRMQAARSRLTGANAATLRKNFGSFMFHAWKTVDALMLMSKRMSATRVLQELIEKKVKPLVFALLAMNKGLVRAVSKYMGTALTVVASVGATGACALVPGGAWAMFALMPLAKYSQDKVSQAMERRFLAWAADFHARLSTARDATLRGPVRAILGLVRTGQFVTQGVGQGCLLPSLLGTIFRGLIQTFAKQVAGYEFDWNVIAGVVLDHSRLVEQFLVGADVDLLPLLMRLGDNVPVGLLGDVSTRIGKVVTGFTR